MNITQMEREAIVSILDGLTALREEYDSTGSEVYEHIREILVDSLLNYKDIVTNSEPDIVNGGEFTHYGSIGRADDSLKIVTSVENEVVDSIMDLILGELGDLACED